MKNVTSLADLHKVLSDTLDSIGNARVTRISKFRDIGLSMETDEQLRLTEEALKTAIIMLIQNRIDVEVTQKSLL